MENYSDSLDEYCHYKGMSAIISPIGKTLASCQADKQTSVSFSLNLEALNHQRQKFQVLDDRDIR